MTCALDLPSTVLFHVFRFYASLFFSGFMTSVLYMMLCLFLSFPVFWKINIPLKIFVLRFLENEIESIHVMGDTMPVYKAFSNGGTCRSVRRRGNRPTST